MIDRMTNKRPARNILLSADKKEFDNLSPRTRKYSCRPGTRKNLITFLLGPEFGNLCPRTKLRVEFLGLLHTYTVSLYTDYYIKFIAQFIPKMSCFVIPFDISSCIWYLEWFRSTIWPTTVFTVHKPNKLVYVIRCLFSSNDTMTREQT